MQKHPCGPNGTQIHSHRTKAAHLLRLMYAGLLFAMIFAGSASRSLGAQSTPRSRPMKIAVFNSRAVFDSMPGRAAIESAFALEQAKARTMLNAATDSLRQAVEEFSRAEARLSPRQREATTMNLRARELLVEELVANFDAIIMRKNEELQAPIRDRVRAAVRELREREGYDLIIDLAQDQLFIEADPRIDVTMQIVRALRAPSPAPAR